MANEALLHKALLTWPPELIITRKGEGGTGSGANHLHQAARQEGLCSCPANRFRLFWQDLKLSHPSKQVCISKAYGVSLEWVRLLIDENDLFNGSNKDRSRLIRKMIEDLLPAPIGDVQAQVRALLYELAHQGMRPS